MLSGSIQNLSGTGPGIRLFRVSKKSPRPVDFHVKKTPRPVLFSVEKVCAPLFFCSKKVFASFFFCQKSLCPVVFGEKSACPVVYRVKKVPVPYTFCPSQFKINIECSLITSFNAIDYYKILQG